MTNSKLARFYKHKPLFGFDIGGGSIKIVQFEHTKKKIHLLGYGKVDFNSSAIKDGEIINYEELTQAAHNLIEQRLAGVITTHRIAASLPVLHSFSRIISLPPMEDKDVLEAVKLEAEQYIPIPINQLYLDYQLVEKTAASVDYLVAAAPKRVVDSYMNLFNTLNLEVVAMEPSILSVARIVQHAEDSNIPTLVIDCGSITTDLIVYHKSNVRVTGTVKFGGDAITKNIQNKFGVDEKEANRIKSVYGLDPGDKREKILEALGESLHFLMAEVKKIIQFFEEREIDQNVKVEQIIVLGGGANMPGLSTYLTSELRLPTRLASIWQHINMKDIHPPSKIDTAMYATAAGLALIQPEDAAK